MPEPISYTGLMRYACPTIDSIWSNGSKLDRWLRIWSTISAALGHPFPLYSDSGSIEQIRRNAELLEQRTGHDVAATVQALRSFLIRNGQTEAAQWLHYSSCSSDIVDTGWLLAIREANTELIRLVGSVVHQLERLRKASQQTRTLYRTHGQAAQVATGDFRWDGYRSEFSRATGKLVGLRPNRIGFAGPTGTGSSFTPQQVEMVCRNLELSWRDPFSGQQANDRTEWALWLHSVAALATLAQRVATQIRLLAYEEVGEVTEGRDDGYVGSSSMPHKSEGGRSNPTRSERICGLAAVIRSMANGYAEAASSVWDSHSLEHSCADRILIPQITGYTGFVLVELAQVLETLKLDVRAMSINAGEALDRWDGEDSYQRRNRLVRENSS